MSSYWSTLRLLFACLFFRRIKIIIFLCSLCSADLTPPITEYMGIYGMITTSWVEIMTTPDKSNDCYYTVKVQYHPVYQCWCQGYQHDYCGDDRSTNIQPAAHLTADNSLIIQIIPVSLRLRWQGALRVSTTIIHWYNYISRKYCNEAEKSLVCLKLDDSLKGL